MRLFIYALWSPAGKGLASLLSFVVSHFPIGILGQVWYLTLSILDLCTLTYFDSIPHIKDDSILTCKVFLFVFDYVFYYVLPFIYHIYTFQYVLDEKHATFMYNCFHH